VSQILSVGGHEEQSAVAGRPPAVSARATVIQTSRTAPLVTVDQSVLYNFYFVC
jgi:hypothetical protein